MRRNSKLLFLVLAAAVGIMAGLTVRVAVKHRAAAREVVSGAPVPQRPVTGKAPNQPQHALSLARRLESDLSSASGVTRWFYWFDALEKAKADDFPDLVRLVHGNPTGTRLVASRWIDLNPRHFFDTMVAVARHGHGRDADELAHLLFREWPKRDPEAAIAALNETTDFGRLRYWRDTVAETVIENDPERGLKLFAEWGIGAFGPSMTAVSKWASANPRHAAEFTLQHPSGYASRLTMETVGQEWANVDPVAALDFATSTPGELGNTLAQASLKTWSERSKSEAAAWLAAADLPVRNQLSPAFVEIWAKDEPAQALGWCEEHLSGSGLASATAAVVKGASAKDVGSAAGLVTAMEPSPGRAEGAVAVAQKWLGGQLLGVEHPAPPELIPWLRQLDTESIRRVFDETSWEWATSDPRTMAELLTTLGREAVPDYSYTVLAQELARRNPQEALEWASRLPAGAAAEAGGAAFAQWRLSQPETATQWFQNLPTGDPRREPFFESTVRALAYDAQLSDQFTTMNSAERGAARRVIENMSLSGARRSQLLDLLR